MLFSTLSTRQRDLSRSSEHHILFVALRNSHFALATAVSRFSTLAFRSLGNDDEVKD